MASKSLVSVKEQIIQALSHPEAQDGLYFRNFVHLHEEDERLPVQGTEEDILDALHQLIKEGRVNMDNGEGEAIFSLTH